MSKIEKLLEKMQNNPSDWTISDLERLAEHYQVQIRQGKGSHVYFTFPNGISLSVPAKRPVKAIYINTFLNALNSPLESPKEEL
jgi:hypothetical protein